MRILHLVNDVEDLGNGIVNVTVDLACAQADDGHEVVVASAGGGWERLLAAHGVRHAYLDQRRRPGALAAVLPRLNRLVARLRPDVVHAHNLTGVLLARVAGAGRWPLVTTVHREQANARLTRLADLIIVLSEDARVRLSAQGLPGDRLRVLRNGTVDGARARSREPLPPLELEHPAVVTVCGLYPRKGVGDLLQALVTVHESVPTARLYVVGDGPQRDELKTLARELGVDHLVTWEGFQSRADRWLAAADVFVLASHQEPGGLVLAEARAAGCAVVATETSGNPNMLDGGRAGLLVPPAEPSALAEALLRVLRDDDERDRLRAAALHGVEDLRVARLARDVERVYVEAVDGRRARTR